jgi:circadian clock protein KaiC
MFNDSAQGANAAPGRGADKRPRMAQMLRLSCCAASGSALMPQTDWQAAAPQQSFPSDKGRMSKDRTTQPERCRSGIEGLDDILGGGFPRNRLHLVHGHPGVGKTTLALQFLLQGKAEGETCLYITLSETAEELLAVAQSHGWNLEGLHLFDLSSVDELLKAESQNTLFHPSEVELSQTADLILREIARLQPTRVVFDSLSELRLLAQSPLRYRRQILMMKQFFIGRKCTVFMLDDSTASRADEQVQSLVHGVVALEQLEPEYGAERRRLNVEKMRGVRFSGGYHDYIIIEGGLVVFPRLIASEHAREFKPEPIPSGIPEFDKLLGGGFDRGTSNLIIGPAGCGKSTLAIHYALTLATRGERTAFFAFDENLGTLVARATALNQELSKQLKTEMICLHQVNPAELSPGELTLKIRRAVEEDGVRMVIIDSLNGYTNAMPQEKFLTLQLHELLAYLGHKGVISILVVAQHGMVGHMSVPVDLTYLSDTAVLLRYFEATGQVKQVISVFKKRSGHHERTLREFQIGPHGIRIGEPLTSFQGVLTGVPQFFGKTTDILEQQSERND